MIEKFLRRFINPLIRSEGVPRTRTGDPLGMTRALSAALANVAVKRGEAGLTFDDLTTPARYQGATVGQLADWLAEAQKSAYIEEVGFDVGSGLALLGARRYRIVRTPELPKLPVGR